MFHRENLYFIAIIPNRDVRTRIQRFKLDLRNRFNTEKAVEIYTHITLKAPFKSPASNHDELVNWFNDLKMKEKSFILTLKNFGSFDNSNHPVVFINVKNEPKLFIVQQNIMTEYITSISDVVNRVDINYKPHVTVAYRDLSSEMFEKAWNEYKDKNFDAEFEVDGFHLLQHNTKKWNLISTNYLS